MLEIRFKVLLQISTKVEYIFVIVIIIIQSNEMEIFSFCDSENGTVCAFTFTIFLDPLKSIKDDVKENWV